MFCALANHGCTTSCTLQDTQLCASCFATHPYFLWLAAKDDKVQQDFVKAALEPTSQESLAFVTIGLFPCPSRRVEYFGAEWMAPLMQVRKKLADTAIREVGTPRIVYPAGRPVECTFVKARDRLCRYCFGDVMGVTMGGNGNQPWYNEFFTETGDLKR